MAAGKSAASAMAERVETTKAQDVERDSPKQTRALVEEDHLLLGGLNGSRFCSEP